MTAEDKDILTSALRDLNLADIQTLQQEFTLPVFSNWRTH